MGDQVYFQDLVEGQEIPSLGKRPTTVDLFMHCASVWLTDRIHYDWPYATDRRELPGVVVPGTLVIDYYVQLLTDWAGEQGELRKLAVQHRSFLVPGPVVTFGAKIAAKTVRHGRGYVELVLWSDNGKGINCAPGRAVVELPIRMAQLVDASRAEAQHVALPLEARHQSR